MKFDIKSPSQSINKVYLKQSISKSNFDDFTNNLLSLISNTNKEETEEHNKNVISDFLKKSFYTPDYYVNTSSNIDLAIHNGKFAKDPIAVIFEVKRPLNKSEMITKDNFNAKALHELVLYYLEEKFSNNNNQIKNLIATNIYDWYIFDAVNFERIFFRDNDLINSFKQWKQHQFDNTSTDYFYNNIAKPFINLSNDTLPVTCFSLKDYFPDDTHLHFNPVNQFDEDFAITLYKLFSPENLLKKPFANDANSLNQEFYNELLYILGLEEQTDNGKKVINRFPQNKRLIGTIIEETIDMIESNDKIDKFKNKEFYGIDRDEQIFSVALELVITWLNRILFLKLLEGQLISYHNNDISYKFLDKEHIKFFDVLRELFFDVLAIPFNERKDHIKVKYDNIPYLNSSLFDKIDLEQEILEINQLQNSYTIPVFSNSVLKDDSGKKITGDKITLEYLLDFLDVYDFSSEGKGKIQEKSKTIINASVLGLIFEKINGYKDGSYFTPSFITMYMARESIRNSIVQKFNEKYNWNCNDFYDVYNFIASNKNKQNILEYNSLINSITICDPAVGSGHFLVSALNELIACKSDLGILADNTGKILPVKVQIENDELIFTDHEGIIFTYNPKNKDSQHIQMSIFNEKVNLIENCLFGVDINPKSVYITRLRLWIELLKNAYYNDANLLETLPNIDMNIKKGNSLVSRFDIHSDKFRIKDLANIEEYKNLVNKYKNVTRKTEKKNILSQIENIKNNIQSFILSKSEQKYKLNKLVEEFHEKFENENLLQFELSEKQKREQERRKNALLAKIETLKKEIQELQSSNENNSNYFEWGFEFPEIFDDDGNFLGFDIVIGNPPYIQLQKDGGKLAKLFEKMNYETFARTGDIYALFYEKGIALLKDNAYLIFITSNKWMRAGYGEKLRNFFTKHKPLILIDLGPGVFESATVDTNILMIQKVEQASLLVKNEEESQSGMIDLPFYACTLKSDIKNNTDIAAYFEANKILMSKPTSNAWTISGDIERKIKEKIEKIGKPLKDWDVKIYRGVLTGLNEAFIIDGKKKDELIATDPESAEIIKPILRGRDIKRYKAEFADLWIIFIPWHFPLHKDPTISGASEKAEDAFKREYPAIYNHLLKYKNQLSKRNKDETGIRYEWYALQRCANTYLDEFEKEKVVWAETDQLLNTVIVPKEMFLQKTCFMIITTRLKLINGYLNSSASQWYIRSSSSNLGTKGMSLTKDSVKEIPLPPITPTNEPIVEQIEVLVDKILEAKKQTPAADTSQWEQEIDELVYGLYGVTEEEIKIIEGGKK
jgi:type II restriction/modification system DNA methylase subunit YeeA